MTRGIMTHGIITDGIADGETLGTTIHGDTIIGIMTLGIIHGDTTHGMARTGTEDMSALSDHARRSRDCLRTETITTARAGAPRQTATEK